MSNVIAQGQSEPNPRVPSGLPSNREQTVAQQVATLLSVVQTYSSILSVTRPDAGVEVLNGKVRASVETTLIRANNLVYEVLNDTNRWSNQNYDDLAVRLRALYEKQNRLFDTQMESASVAMSPHAVLHPQLMRLPSGAWAVFVGNPAVPDGLLLGTGLTLKEAVEKFDAAYFEKPTEEQRKLYEQSKNWSMDARRPQHDADAGSAGRDAGGDSPAPEPDAKGNQHPPVGSPKKRKGNSRR
jgi:hypothetical protein